MNRSRFAWAVAVLGFAVLVAAGCSGKGDEKKPDKDSGGAPKKESSEAPRPAKADFSLTSKEFGEEYKKDKKAAEAKYKGKLIELTGEVKGMGRNLGKEAYLSLEGGPKDLTGVMCFTTDKEPWRKATPGQTVKIKGNWPEFAIVPSLVQCVVTDVSGPAAPSLTADELAKEYAADQAATTKKYDNKYLLLSGEIAKVAFNEAKAATVTFKTAGKPQVACSFTAFEKDETSGLKAGQKLKVLGKYTLNFAKEQVGLYFCLPLEDGK